MAGIMNKGHRAVDELDRRRREVADEMLAIRAVQPGKISEQYLKIRHKGKSEPVKRGPYYVLSWWENGRSTSRRIKRDELERTREEVANYQRLEALQQEFDRLTRALAKAERDAERADEALKKKPNSSSSKKRRSRK